MSHKLPVGLRSSKHALQWPIDFETNFIQIFMKYLRASCNIFAHKVISLKVFVIFLNYSSMFAFQKPVRDIILTPSGTRYGFSSQDSRNISLPYWRLNIGGSFCQHPSSLCNIRLAHPVRSGGVLWWKYLLKIILFYSVNHFVWLSLSMFFVRWPIGLMFCLI